jgi:hypothetical protein
MLVLINEIDHRRHPGGNAWAVFARKDFYDRRHPG